MHDNIENDTYDLYLALTSKNHHYYEDLRSQLIDKYSYDIFRDIQKESFKKIWNERR